MMTCINPRLLILLGLFAVAPAVGAQARKATTTPSAARMVEVRARVDGEEVVNTARQYLGVKYVLGGTTPRAFDCSGFVRWIFAQHGVRMPRTAKEQAGVGNAPAHGDLQPGDLLFFFGGQGAQHIAVYVGGDTIIHASSTAKRVKYDKIGGTRQRPTWFGRRLIAVRRILPAEGVVRVPFESDETFGARLPTDLETALLYREPPVVY